MIASVGWLGAVVAFLVMAVVATSTSVTSTRNALYVAMEVVGRNALVPLAAASLATGLIQSLGTVWGLFRHYWVVVKFLITLGSAAVLLLYTSTLSALAAAAQAPGSDRVLPSISPVVHAVAALVLLSGASALSVFKPRGMTRYGWRRTRIATATA